jgi:hypothetical protein
MITLSDRRNSRRIPNKHRHVHFSSDTIGIVKHVFGNSIVACVTVPVGCQLQVASFRQPVESTHTLSESEIFLTVILSLSS